MNLKIIKPVPDLTDLIEYRDELVSVQSELAKLIREDVSLVEDRNSNKYYEFDKVLKKRKYIRKKDSETLKMLFQNEYYQDFRKIINEELRQLDEFLNSTSLNRTENVYSLLSKERKRYVVPLAVSDQYYAWAWQNMPYATRKISSEDKKFETSKGEIVRSKSEVIIADTLASKGIPYRYEPEFICCDGEKKYPDFLMLDVKRRKEIYLEHLGLTDDPDYMNNVVQKTNQYAKSGVYVGVNLLFTMESDKYPLNRNTLSSTLDSFFGM